MAKVYVPVLGLAPRGAILKEKLPLRIHFDGPAVRRHRITLVDFVEFGGHLQEAVDRIARLLQGEVNSAHPGPKPSEIRSLCTLEISGFEAGSLAVVCDLRQPAQRTLGDDLGEMAIKRLVEGIAEISEKGHEMPMGFDKGVLLSLREGSKVLDRGIDSITFGLPRKAVARKAVIDRPARARIVERIQQPIKNRRTVEGRLLMGDFKESGPRCRIHPPLGKPIQCTFEESQASAILSALRRYVRLTGEAQEERGEIVNLKVEDIEVIGTDRGFDDQPDTTTSFYESHKDIDELAAEQGVTGVASFDDLIGDFWPEDEGVDEFIEAVKEWRRDVGDGARTHG